MAEEFIEEIYSRACIIPRLKKSMEYCRRMQWHLFKLDWASMQEVLAAFCRELVGKDETLADKIWDALVKISNEAGQMNLDTAADEIEEVLPLLYDAMRLYGEIDVAEGDYRLFSSKSGFLCMQNLQNGDMKNSRIDPVWEAWEKARSIYTPRMQRFCSIGCDLGYLVWQMFELTNQGIDIYIYDTDTLMTGYAGAFGVLDHIPQENLHIIIEKDPDRLMDRFMKEQFRMYQENKAVLHVDNEAFAKLSSKGKELASELMSSNNTFRNFAMLEEQNFYRNHACDIKMIDELIIPEDKKEWIIVGAGPSLDEELPYLRSMQGVKLILAATTVYKKLTQEGIVADYYIAIDPQNRTFDHFKDIAKQDKYSPLILRDSANWQFAQKYPGEKYLIPTGEMFYANTLYDLTDIKTWDVKSNVSPFAIEVALKKGAERIELIGVDLAYPGAKSHAGDTMDHSSIDTDGLIKIKDVKGQDVYTSDVFLDCIAEIEELIHDNNNVKFYNRSKIGAHIKGCNNV